MRKCFYMFVLPALCLALLAGCIAAPEPEGSLDQILLEDTTGWDPTPHETVNNLAGAAMTVAEETVSPTGLTVKFENDSDSDCIYGEYFGLERLINGQWYQVPVTIEGDYAFEDIGYELPSGASSEWTVDWEWLYGSVEPGEYRIVKILDFRGAGDFEQYYLAAGCM